MISREIGGKGKDQSFVVSPVNLELTIPSIVWHTLNSTVPKYIQIIVE